MRTTLTVPDAVFRELKRFAAKRGIAISEVVTEMVLEGLAKRPQLASLPPLPSFNMGRPLVDVADRDALYDVLEAERDARLYGVKKGR